MIGEAIRIVLTNLPLTLFVLALLIPTLRGQRSAEAYLSWLLLLSVGIDGLWAGLFHVFMPHAAARFIGWQVSPFQFEMGVTDIAFGVTAIVAFWRSLNFKAATVTFISLLYVGLAIGHLRQIVETGNLAPGNGGMLLVLTVIKPVLLVWLLMSAQRQEARLVNQRPTTSTASLYG
jgi:uncharacterized membrane protein